MGMAASQARYLALTARKTNTEWEGQQINQARTALANQSANLFNRLLGLEVPNAPKTTDYTELQYSYTDGENESVLESWQQLSSADPDYNYIVNSYYYAHVYTGSKKLLENPEVQSKNIAKKETYDNDGQVNPVVSFSDGTYTIINNDTGEVLAGPFEALKDKVETDNTLEESLRDFEVAKGMATADGVLNTDDVYGYQDASGTWHFFVPNENDPVSYTTEYKPAYVGNSKLTELSKLTKDENIDQVAELAQILKDCPDSSIKDYLSFDDNGNLIYTGEGIYTFDYQGKTYFTTEKDLQNSIQSPNSADKPIEVQDKLAYYNASYIKTKIEQTNHALLETDGNGRFKSVKFDNNSVVYDLNVETVTDEAAYKDAMNEYNYKKEQYEKTIADINAKTSIIQQEDRTLELRLKQLDTEQNALATEMDAVKKVIKDNVEKTFKTFSD